LKLSFAPAWLRWLPSAWEDHWVLHLEPDYSAALVGNPQRTQLALMVRRFKGCEGAVDRMIEIARLQGYAVDELQFVSSANSRPPATSISPTASLARQRERTQRV
ncbi:MAG: lipocalin family protein, partial [Rubrivivax sp.]